MTACTNNGGSRARRAVTAALVGVLSVGAAPMVALATEAAPVAGDVQLQATTNPAFQGSTVYYSNGESGASFVYNEGMQGLEPESYSNYGTSEKLPGNFTYSDDFGAAAPGNHYAYVRVDQDAAADYPNGVSDGVGGVVKYIGEDGSQVTLRGDDANVSDMVPGTYAVVVYYSNGSGSFVARTIADTFTIVNGGLEGATLVDDGDVSDSTFEFTGENGSAQANKVLARLGVAVDGVELTKGTDYQVVKFYEKGKNVDLSSKSDLLKVGTTYVVDIEGTGEGYDGVKASLEFTFGQLELNKVSVVSVAAKPAAPATTRVSNVVKELNGVAAAQLNDSRFSVSVSGPDANGVYTYTIGQSESDKKGDNFVTGTATVTVAVGMTPVSFLYNGATITAGGQWSGAAGGYTYTYDMTDSSQKPFDLSKVTASNGSADVACTHTVQNAKTGAAATDADLATRGEWIVTVVANGLVDGQRWVGSETITVKNDYKLTDAANVFVSYDGKLVPGSATVRGTIKDNYDGTDLTDKVSVTVKAGDKTLVEGTDYTVEYTTKDQTGKTVKVDEVVDAGDYVMTVKGVTYDGTATYDFKVMPRDLDTVVPASPFAVEENVDLGNGHTGYTVYYLSHTGDELEPALTFTGDDGKQYTVDACDVTWRVAFKSDKVALKDEGTYVIDSVALKDGNFTGSPALPSKTVVVVTSASAFVDVPNDAWYAEEVATAKQQGYIGGVNGTNFFAPMNNISRADMACVLYRMAGGAISSDEDMTSEEKGYISRFEDVDEGAYYAKAIAWTTKMGITNGYGTTFGISRDITTEEFVTMLVRYAEKVGTDVSVSDVDAVLAGVEDGSKVTGYAREAVAWAVEQGYVAKDGNLIDPQGSVYRARAIKIAVDYQPEQLATIL